MSPSGKLFRLVRACGREEVLVASWNSIPEALANLCLFPFGPGSFPFPLPPTPQISYLTLFGLIGIEGVCVRSLWHSPFFLISIDKGSPGPGTPRTQCFPGSLTSA